MDKCGHCAYWANNSFTGTSSCRLTKRDDVGYFAPSCEHFERREQPTKPKETMETTETTNTAPQTKVCKICGRELPLDSFLKHPRTKDGHTTICADCFRTKNADSLRKAAENSAAARKGNKRGPYKPRAIETKPVPAVQVVRVGIDTFTDRQLYDELRRRGWTGTLTRTETLE